MRRSCGRCWCRRSCASRAGGTGGCPSASTGCYPSSSTESPEAVRALTNGEFVALLLACFLDLSLVFFALRAREGEGEEAASAGHELLVFGAGSHVLVLEGA